MLGSICSESSVVRLFPQLRGWGGGHSHNTSVSRETQLELICVCLLCLVYWCLLESCSGALRQSMRKVMWGSGSIQRVAAAWAELTGSCHVTSISNFSSLTDTPPLSTTMYTLLVCYGYCTANRNQPSISCVQQSCIDWLIKPTGNWLATILIAG